MSAPTHDSKLPKLIEVNPKASISPVKTDAHDLAIGIDSTDPAKSVIIGTDKGKVGGKRIDIAVVNVRRTLVGGR